MAMPTTPSDGFGPVNWELLCQIYFERGISPFPTRKEHLAQLGPKVPFAGKKTRYNYPSVQLEDELAN
jgi:hypothetical protein